ncbi:hypothetical protein HOO68_02160 [Candidatus Gracilibacteria bacterium]|nr:hypothetical protein [Candidatus Gracilibacteria bacterium]
MKKYLALYATICTLVAAPALFAETTGTGTITGTGTTVNTGVVSTGTTNTGTSNTGTTNTGSTGTGTSCTVGTGFQMDLIVAQEKYSIELTRLITEKKVAFLVAMTLTGTAKVDAIKAANLKFKTGHQAALKIRNTVKKDAKSSLLRDKMLCKNNKKNDDKKLKHSGDNEQIGHDSNDDDDDRDDDKQKGKDKNKSQMKDLKKSFKEIKKIEKKFSNHR